MGALLCLWVSLLFWGVALGHVQWNPHMQSIGTAIKAEEVKAGEEVLLFEHTGGPGVIVEQWCTGQAIVQNNTVVRVYVDGETTPSIQYWVPLAHGLGPRHLAEGQTKTHPFGNELLGSSNGIGFYNTFHIPFESHVRLTAYFSQDGGFYYMVRGVVGLPLMVGELALPSTMKLKLYAQTLTVPADVDLTLADVKGSSGMVSHVTMFATSNNYLFQEGCVRAIINGNTTLYMSSGMEDYFLGDYFHSMPLIRTVVSGFAPNATYDVVNNKFNSVVGYRIHHADPVLFSDSLVLQWHVGGRGGSWCPHKFPPANSGGEKVSAVRDQGSVNITTYAWVYSEPSSLAST